MSKPSCFVATVSPDVAEKLQSDLALQGFEISNPANTIFSAQKKGISCTLYKSGKLTVQGKDKDPFINFYLEPEILGTFSYSYPEANLDLTSRIGIDEAGKGDFFGALCIGGLQAEGDKILDLVKIGVRDSKRLSDTTVLALSKKIRLNFAHSIVRISPLKYNELYGQFHNLNHLLAWGHGTAIAELVAKTGCTKVTIDQFASESLVINALKRRNLNVNLTQRHKAEEDIVVAGASILARAAFLESIEQLGEMVSMPLPKGASDKVIQVSKKLIEKKGREILKSVAKLHFKITEQL